MVNFLHGLMLMQDFLRDLLGSLLFLMRINYLANDLSASAKLFADDTSLFSVVFNLDASAK